MFWLGCLTGIAVTVGAYFAVNKLLDYIAEQLGD